MSRNTSSLSHIQEQKVDGPAALTSLLNGLMQSILAAPAVKRFCLREINENRKRPKLLD